MDLEKVCYGCFRGKSGDTPVCPYCGFSVDEEQPFLALPMGTVLRGRYLMGRVLGVGGFGITYVGYDLTLEMKVAVKEYFPSGSAMRTGSISGNIQWDFGENEEKQWAAGIDRFLKEARRMAESYAVNGGYICLPMIGDAMRVDEEEARGRMIVGQEFRRVCREMGI